MHRDPDGACLVGDRTSDRLADPPDGISDELHPSPLIEPHRSVYKADVSLFNPDNAKKGCFGDWFNLAAEELNKAGYSFTRMKRIFQL
jgi:hypothetical protein